ncbi:MAG: PadR family transcriptional regulator [Acetivibrionales bacterium]
MNVQYKKGVIELCVLSMLYRKDSYGYDISEYISKRINISDGTIYPILRKLKSEGLVTTYLSEESGGPPRKYYRITDLGRRQYLDDKTEWLNFASEVEKLLKEDGDE